MDLKGAVAVVTGGNGGLGQRICHTLAREGAHVAVMYARSRDQAESVAGDALRLVAAARVHDSDMRALLRQRMADALPQPAIAARHECNRALQIHRLSPLVRTRGLIAATPPFDTVPAPSLVQRNLKRTGSEIMPVINADWARRTSPASSTCSTLCNSSENSARISIRAN